MDFAAFISLGGQVIHGPGQFTGFLLEFQIDRFQFPVHCGLPSVMSKMGQFIHRGAHDL